MQDLMCAWQAGAIDDAAVVAWAERVFVETERPGDLPDWLYELCVKGPTACMQMPASDLGLPRPRDNFQERFLLALSLTDLEDRAALERFVRTAMRCMGEDLNLPEVQLGYYFDHLVYDCDDMNAAIEYARAELPKFLDAAYAVRARVLSALEWDRAMRAKRLSRRAG